MNTDTIEESKNMPEEHQLEFVIGHESDSVTIHFNFPIKMIGINPATAISLAESLIDHALVVVETKRLKVENSIQNT